MCIQSVLHQISSIPLMININIWRRKLGGGRKVDDHRVRVSAWPKRDIFFSYMESAASLRDREREDNILSDSSRPAGLSPSRAPRDQPRPWSSGHSSSSSTGGTTYHTSLNYTRSAGTRMRTRSVKYLGGWGGDLSLKSVYTAKMWRQLGTLDDLI